MRELILHEELGEHLLLASGLPDQLFAIPVSELLFKADGRVTLHWCREVLELVYQLVESGVVLSGLFNSGE